MTSTPQTLFSKYLNIFIVVCIYWIVSILTVFVNKRLLSGIKLDTPLLIACYQNIIVVLICSVKQLLSSIFSAVSFPEARPFRLKTIKDVLPLSIMFTSMIVTNNLCLKYVSVAFYHVSRSLTTIFNVALTYIILGEKTSLRSLFFCSIVIFGFFLGIDQENLAGSLSITGTIFGILSSLSMSFYATYTKIVLPKVNDEIWLLSYYNNIYSAMILAPAIFLNGEFIQLMTYEDLYDHYFWFVMTVSGICAFSVGFLTSLQIKVTSALTHNISGTAKACAQTVLATYWYNEVKSLMWWISNALVLIGSAGYARVKQLDMEQKHLETHQYSKV